MNLAFEVSSMMMGWQVITDHIADRIADRAPRSAVRGFTIPELMITIAIVGILAAVAVPQFRLVSANSNLRSSTADLIQAVNLARAEAVNLRGVVTLRPLTGNDWASGWQVNYEPGLPGETMEFRPRANISVVATPGLGQLDFNANGTVSAVVTFTLCGGGANGEIGRDLALNRLGRMENTEVVCP